MDKLISLKDAKINFRGKTIFEHLNFNWHKGQQWALIGANGSGKSAWLMTMAGKFIVADGSLTHPFGDPYKPIEQPENPFFTYHDLIQMVDIRHDFRNKSNLKEFYYQQRYNADHADNAPAVGEYLADQQRTVVRETYWTLDKVAEIFHLKALWNKSLIKLSNGESKRLRLAAALLKHPKILLLDNTFAGLDVETRAEMSQILDEIVKSGIHIMLITTPNEIPEVITNVLVLDECQVFGVHAAGAYDAAKHVPLKLHPVDIEKIGAVVAQRKEERFETIIEMKDATVRYGDLILLENVNWTVKYGERWGLSGPNGSGKSTLLSLINGDHPQAYACDLTLFDTPRGTGESIWDIKAKIGFMSPELFQFFPTYYTCRQVVVSVFYQALGSRKQGTPEQEKMAEEWLTMLGLASRLDATLDQLSASEQRLCLLARALVRLPALLILDEPCQGLDAPHQEQFRKIIDEVCARTPISLIYVTHYQQELPTCITQFMQLKSQNAD